MYYSINMEVWITCCILSTHRLFLCATQTTSRSASVSLSAPAARRAPWCTTSSGSPRAGSSPPQPYQYGSPVPPPPTKNNNQFFCSWVQFIFSSSRPDESLLASQSDWTPWSWTGWGCPGFSGASGWSPWTGCRLHTEELEPNRTGEVDPLVIPII